jgi:hypothetical protein
MARTFSTATQTTADLEANASLAKALSPYVSANRALINTAVSEQAKTFRTLQKIIGDFNNASNTGDSRGFMNAAVDLATAPLQNTPMDRNLANEVNTILAANPGQQASNPNVARKIWQDAALRHVSDGAQAWGNVDYLREITGMQGKTDAEILAVVAGSGTDPDASRLIGSMLDQATRQQGAMDIARGMQNDLAANTNDLLKRHGSVENIPQDELDKFYKDNKSSPNLLQAHSTFGMADIKKLADAEANKEVVLTGTAKDEYEFNQKMQERLLEQSTTESDRDRAAALVNSPKFQEWARSNGFTLGTVTAPDPNKQYEKAELTTSGLYSPGRDDYKAIMLAQRQLSQDPNKWHPFMPQGAGTRGNLQEYGSINVQLAPPSAAAPAPAPVSTEPPEAQEFTDAAGWTYRLYNGEVSVIGGPKGKETAATPATPLKLSPEDARKALSELLSGDSAEVDAALADSKAPAAPPPSEAAPTEEPETETVYGAFNKKFGADPIGSQRVSGKLYLKDATTGNFYLAPDQAARAEGTTLTAGGGPNAYKAFAQEVRARREANIARRLEDKEGGAKAPLRTAAIGLAQTLTPERQTEVEKARAVEYTRQQEMERRALEKVAAEAPTSQREAVLRAQQAWNTASADQGFLGKEFYDGADAPISAVPRAPYTPESTLPNAGADSGVGRGVVPAPATPRAEAVANRPEAKSEGTKLGGTPKTPPLTPKQQDTQAAKVREWLANNPANVPLTTPPPKDDYKNILDDGDVTIKPVEEPAPPKQTSQRGAILNQQPQYRDLLMVPTAKSVKPQSSMA